MLSQEDQKILYLHKNQSMAYIAGIVGVIPIRAEPSHKSEMVSQLLFGETAELLEGDLNNTGGFIKIKLVYDGYMGWCQSAQLALVDGKIPPVTNLGLAPDFTNIIVLNGLEMRIPFGSSLSLFNNGQWNIGKRSFEYQGNIAKPNAALFTPDYIQHITSTYLQVPYLWGGRSVFGIDCSGFSQQVYQFFNKYLPRDASQQVLLGEVVGFLQEVHCGDLAFFDNEEGKITHVGIMLNETEIIHASGQVRIDKLDNMGIIHAQTGVRTHRLRIIKRHQ